MSPVARCLLLASLAVLSASAREMRMSYIENDAIRLGVDLNVGGAITWLSKRGGDNVVNSHDLGRQIQMSYYSGPVPYAAGGKQPAKHWEHLGWNPIQAGDDFDNGSRVLDHRNEAGTIYVKCVPMQWPLENEPADCVFESWLELEGAVVKARCRLTNARADRAAFSARLQEMPAVYLNAPFHRVVSYTGDRPFMQDATMSIPRPQANPDTWSQWLATERWSALLNDEGWGVGVWSPGCVSFIGGYAGPRGPNDPRSLTCGYLAPQRLEVIDHNITHEYRYELIVGSELEIRARAAAMRGESEGLRWTFTQDRQGWHPVNAQDNGWPLNGEIALHWSHDDPQWVGPLTFWRAEDMPRLMIEAAFRTEGKTAHVLWRRFGEKRPGNEDVLPFPVQGDGEYREITLDLSQAAAYTGGMIQLRFDPPSGGGAGEWMKIRRVELRK